MRIEASAWAKEGGRQEVHGRPDTCMTTVVMYITRKIEKRKNCAPSLLFADLAFATFKTFWTLTLRRDR